MNAYETRQKALEALEQRKVPTQAHLKEFDTLMKDINSAASKGNLHVGYSTNLSVEPFIEFLKFRGYSVEECSYWNHNFKLAHSLHISW